MRNALILLLAILASCSSKPKIPGAFNTLTRTVYINTNGQDPVSQVCLDDGPNCLTVQEFNRLAEVTESLDCSDWLEHDREDMPPQCADYVKEIDYCAVNYPDMMSECAAHRIEH